MLQKLEILGEVNQREIQYLNVRTNPSWFDLLPLKNWIAFTVADEEDEDLLNEVTMKILDKGVLYTCSSGQLASETETYFIQEIAWRKRQKEEQTGIPVDFDKTPSFSFNRNFNSEFWFATTVAKPIINNVYLQVDIVTCIDFTIKGVKKHLSNLISKINNGWLPSDEESEEPVYDF